jgi:hypothetical protein
MLINYFNLGFFNFLLIQNFRRTFLHWLNFYLIRTFLQNLWFYIIWTLAEAEQSSEEWVLLVLFAPNKEEASSPLPHASAGATGPALGGVLGGGLASRSAPRSAPSYLALLCLE